MTTSTYRIVNWCDPILPGDIINVPYSGHWFTVGTEYVTFPGDKPNNRVVLRPQLDYALEEVKAQLAAAQKTIEALEARNYELALKQDEFDEGFSLLVRQACTRLYGGAPLSSQDPRPCGCPGYRRVLAHEVIAHGDEFFANHTWRPCRASVGHVKGEYQVTKNRPVRRKTVGLK